MAIGDCKNALDNKIKFSPLLRKKVDAYQD